MSDRRVLSLKQHRMLAGVTIRELAQRIKETSGKSISTRTLVRVEDGQSAHVRTFRRIADALGIEPTDIQEFRDLVEEAGAPEPSPVPTGITEEFAVYQVSADPQRRLGSMATHLMTRQRLQELGLNDDERTVEAISATLAWLHQNADFDVIEQSVTQESDIPIFTYEVVVRSISDEMLRVMEATLSDAGIDSPVDDDPADP